MIIKITFSSVEARAAALASRLIKHFQLDSLSKAVQPIAIKPVGQGGAAALLSLRLVRSNFVPACTDTENPEVLIVDVLRGVSGEVQEYLDTWPGAIVDGLVDATNPEDDLYQLPDDDRIFFPWGLESSAPAPTPFTSLIRGQLAQLGEDPDRGGLLETPKRVEKAWRFWTKGYHEDPAEVLKVFEDGAEKCDQMVIVKDIPIYSHCEHHMAAIFGTASIAYIPNGKIVGLSKLSRVADIFARRLQVQERLTNQIADALWTNLDPKGVGVIIKARHLCMESRGICQQGHHTITSALRGAIKTDSSARAEFMRLAG